MSKEFEHYNKEYMHLKRKDTDESQADQALAKTFNKWQMQTAQWDRVEIADAVYTSATAEEWQKFRVSLKGQSTRMKLVRLHKLLVDALTKPQDIEESMRVQCRVDNYLGALIRGGQLSPNYEVIK